MNRRCGCAKCRLPVPPPGWQRDAFYGEGTCYEPVRLHVHETHGERVLRQRAAMRWGAK